MFKFFEKFLHDDSQDDDKKLPGELPEAIKLNKDGDWENLGKSDTEEAAHQKHIEDLKDPEDEVGGPMTAEELEREQKNLKNSDNYDEEGYPDPVGETQYDRLINAAEDESVIDIYSHIGKVAVNKESEKPEFGEEIQEKILTEEEKKWAKQEFEKFHITEGVQGRKGNERHNPYKGSDKITDKLADNDNAENTERRQREILDSIDDIAA